jgi:hypothetical protein
VRPTRTATETTSRRLTLKQNHKKADVVKHPKEFDHAGLLVNEPPATGGLLFI